MAMPRALGNYSRWHASANVGAVIGEVPGTWRAVGNDPQFLILPETGTFNPGWYEFRACTGDGKGIFAPCLYIDHGDGVSERTRLRLPYPDADGVIKAVVPLHAPTSYVRFDPTDQDVQFSLSSAQIVRRSRPWAFAAMLSAIIRSNELSAMRVASGAVARFFQIWLQSGLASAVAYLGGRYESTLPSESDNQYQQWVRLYDDPAAEAAKHRARALSLQHGPLISVLMPTYESPERWLRKAIDSVRGQFYSNWELCIADDASQSDHVRRVLEEYAATDPRIRVVFRERNGHISAASNTALEIVRGDYIALLDHDDELAPNALLEVAEAAVGNPGWRIIYSDEDKIDELGRRSDPYFKPDWNYELMLGQNCLSHLGVYETGLVREVGGFRKGFEGSQDWDLALRIIERLGPGQVGHIPKILYHWRAIPGSTALGPTQKDYALDVARKAVLEHLQRVGDDAEVTPLPIGHLKVRRELPAQPPKVTLVIPTRDRVELLKMCIDSILARTDYPDYEILVIDNQSVEQDTRDYFKTLARSPNVRVVSYDRPFNYSAINNHAVSLSSGELIALVNNDIEVISPDWLREMAAHAVRPDVGAVGAMLYYPDDTIQHGGVLLGFGGVAGHAFVHRSRGWNGDMSRAGLTQELSAVTAACLLVRRKLFQAVGGLDEGLQVAFNDVDLCLRLKAAGYRNIWTPFAELYHHESASRGYEDTPEKLARFHREIAFMRSRWGEMLDNDPAYNPNLSLTGEPFSLAFPPRKLTNLH